MGFSAQLKKEAKNQQGRYAALFVRYRARNSAHMICRRISLTEKTQLGNHGKLTEETPADEWESMDSGSETPVDDEDNLDEIEGFIKNSKALGSLRESLQEFVSAQMGTQKPNIPDAVEVQGKEKDNEEVYGQSMMIYPTFKLRLATIIQQVTKCCTAFINTLPLEPKELKLGQTRIEWHCVSIIIPE